MSEDKVKAAYEQQQAYIRRRIEELKNYQAQRQREIANTDQVIQNFEGLLKTNQYNFEHGSFIWPPSVGFIKEKSVVTEQTKEP